MKRLFAMFKALALTALVPLSAQASGGHDLNGAELSILWVVPFVCMLLSIAIGPLAVPHFWHHHFGKVALFWGLAFLVPCAMVFGLQLAVYQFVHVLFMEYVPFIILLFALFTIAGGVRLKGQLVGTPVVNAGLLALGTILASWMGTTGAAMLLIRPLLRANEHRKYRMHIVVFFIFPDPPRRPAAVPRLPQGRVLLLDDRASVLQNRAAFRHPARHLLPSGYVPVQQGRQAQTCHPVQ